MILDKDLIAEIARQIVEQQILANWKYYGIVIALIIVGGGFAAYVGAYLAKRGESQAAAADFARLTTQLAETTRLTKNIETSLAHGDWAKREFRTIRRTKLELLLEALSATTLWLEDRRLAPFPDFADASSSPFGTASMLGLLYFPELEQDLNDYYIIHQELVLWSLGARKKSVRLNGLTSRATLQYERGGDGAAQALAQMETLHAEHMTMIDEELARFYPLMDQLRPLARQIEGRAKTLMREAIAAEERDLRSPEIAR